MLRLLGTHSKGPSLASDVQARRSNDPLHSLLTQTIRRDRGAEQTLLTAIGPAVLGVARRVLGVNDPELDDVCQDAAVGFLAALPSFRGECSVLHFACRVTLLTALAARRRKERAPTGHPEALTNADGFVDESASPASLIDAARRRFALRELLDELPLAQAEVLALHVMLGHTLDESSAMIGIPVNTVRSRLRRGLAALRERLISNPELREVVGASHE